MIATVRHCRIATAGSLAAVLSLVVACGGDEGSTAQAPAPAATIQKAAEEKPPAPKATVTENRIPDDFPGDVPLYPGAESERSLGIPGGPTLVAFSSDDDAESILAFYVRELPGEGWTLIDAGAGRGALKASKEKRSLNIRVDAKPSGPTAIAIMVSQG